MSKVIRAAFAAVLMTACGGSSSLSPKDVQQARTAVYASGYEAIFRVTFEAVSAEYKKTAANPDARLIQTPWHQLPLTEHVTTKEQTPRQVGEFNESGGESEEQFFQRRERRRDATDRTMRYFVRFDVKLEQVNGAPGAPDARWKVEIAGHASQWDGTARPEPLTGAATPYWLAKRVDRLQVAIHDRLASMAVGPAVAPAPQ